MITGNSTRVRESRDQTRRTPTTVRIRIRFFGTGGLVSTSRKGSRAAAPTHGTESKKPCWPVFRVRDPFARRALVSFRNAYGDKGIWVLIPGGGRLQQGSRGSPAHTTPLPMFLTSEQCARVVRVVSLDRSIVIDFVPFRVLSLWSYSESGR